MSAPRACGSCHLCCRVFPVPEVHKPPEDWCALLTHGEGCSIYESRPARCRDFHCLWLGDEDLDEHWRPDRAGFVLSDPAPWGLLVTCDPARPAAWRQERYESHIRQWARQLGARGLFAGVRAGENLILLLGDGEHMIEGA